MSPRSGSLERVVGRFRAGEIRGLARAISLVEDRTPGHERLLAELHEGVGRARRVGITGPPGAGKSTLTAGLARSLHGAGLRVAILAADPTSPFTGGALLGDRIRMSQLATEPGIFIRSMASRGSLGGMATASREAADLLDAFGFDRILVETVGVGQSELEVARWADTTVVVLVPESGDGIQAMKAGLMEVADLFVVNKADRPGAGRLCREIRVMLRMREGRLAAGAAGHHGAETVRAERSTEGRGAAAPGPGGDAAGGSRGSGKGRAGRGTSGTDAEGEDGETPSDVWDVPVLETVASTGEGLKELAERIDAHFEHMRRTGRLERRRREHLLRHARAVLGRRTERAVEAVWKRHGGEVEGPLTAGRITPYEAAGRLADRLVEGLEEGLRGGEGRNDGGRNAV